MSGPPETMVYPCGPRAGKLVDCSPGERAEYIRDLYRLEWDDGTQAVGLKILFYQAQTAACCYEALAAAKAKIILLHRNPLECVISQQQAGSGKKWHSDKYPEDLEEGKLGAPRVNMRMEWVVKYLDDVALGYKRVSKIIDPSRILSLRYHEDLANNFVETMKTVQEWLGLDPVLELQPQLRKIDDRLARERAINWKDLERGLPKRHRHWLATVQ